MSQTIGVLAELERSLISERTRRRSNSGAVLRRQVWAKGEADPEQINHARKLIDKGEARQYVADLNALPGTEPLTSTWDSASCRWVFPRGR
jgi:DNA invertase Pin-like site-specific DNA recombinase